MREPDDHKLIEEMRSIFLVPISSTDYMRDFDNAMFQAQGYVRSVFEAFRHNATSAMHTVALPFNMASSSAELRHFQRIHIAERIRAEKIQALAVDADPANECADIEVKRDAVALENAKNEIRKYFESEDGRNALIRDTCGFLLDCSRNGMELAAYELLHQGLILAWSSFEVLFRDAFETMLNANCNKIADLLKHPDTSKRFDANRITIDVLIQNNFNLSDKIGTFLVGKNDFSDLPSVKAIYSVLFPNGEELRAALSDNRLWLLYQRRNLIVHRRGIVDAQYQEKSGESVAVGERLVLRPTDFEKAITAVIASGTALANVFKQVYE